MYVDSARTVCILPSAGVLLFYPMTPLSSGTQATNDSLRTGFLTLGIEWIPTKQKPMIHGNTDWGPVVFRIIHETDRVIEWE